MEPYLMITQLNDFIFCPRSIFFSGIFRNTADTSVYHDVPQTIGSAVHRTVDDGTYSTSTRFITGITVYSAKYNLLGCIDILDTEKKLLTERKYSVTAIYDGFRWQLYAQYFALLEMGFDVTLLRIHSVKDNKNYPIDLPTTENIQKFENLLNSIRSFSLNAPFTPNQNKCRHCIYNPLCDCCSIE